MITKKQLQAMSDFEVNKALAITMGLYAGEVGGWMPNGVKVNDETGLFYSEMNYCSTPNDIMPLAFERFINLNHTGIDWIAFNADFDVIHVNPLRAIACCLILVLQDQQK